MEQMRILNVTDSFLPTIGGMEKAIDGLTRQRAGEGHHVMVLTATHPDAPADEETVHGVRIMRRPMSTQKIPGALKNDKRPFHVTMPDPLFMRGVREAIRVHRPDVIHCHGWSRFSVLPVARKHRVPVVGTAHDFGYICAVKHATFPDGSVCNGPSLSQCLAHASRYYGPKGVPLALGLRSMVPLQQDMTITAISTSIAEFGAGTPYALPDMVKVPSFIADEALELADATRPEWAPDGDYLMFVGALTRYKGVQVLLDAHRLLREERGLSIPLLLLGTPQPDTPNLDLPHVTVLTEVPNVDVMRAWKYATVGAAPSVLPEGFGQVVVEALGAGTPMIGTNHGGIPEIITHGVNGLLIEPNDAAALADAIEMLWGNPELRARLAAAGQERAKDFTLSRVGPRFLDVYAHAIEQNRARTGQG